MMSRPPSGLMKILFLTITTGIGASAMGFCSVCVAGERLGSTLNAMTKSGSSVGGYSQEASRIRGDSGKRA